MIGTLNHNSKEVTIIGAGISGLLTAYYLDRRGYRVTLLEQKQRAGGLIKTSYSDYGMAESAAHSLIATPPVVELCKDLGVELIEPKKESKAKYIVRDGKLRRFPLTVGEVATTASRAAFVRSTNGNGQTLDEWGRKHLGNAAVEYLLTPFVRGIYGVQPEQLSVAAAYPSLSVPPGQTLLSSMMKKQKQRSRKKEAKKRVAPRFGMGHLVSCLSSRLDATLGPRFQTGHSVKVLPDAANLILTTPAYAAANLIEPESVELAQSLRTVRYTPIVSVTVFVNRKDFTRAVEGVGALVPACENRKCLGILFNSSSFADRVNDESNVASFTVMMGGTTQIEWLDADNEMIWSTVQSELLSLLGIREVLDLVIHRWPQALPQYSVDLPKVWQTAKETWCATPGRMLFGNYTGQISLRGMIESSAALS
ncbi:MAG: protoporphyrinogen oxidase [Blastocatellia bacterium]|nr:MAG: protoporphyrinogen oxidase [Blastocatellia bacterium]